MIVYQPALEHIGGQALPPFDEIDVDGQLLCYAHDLQELMTAHSSLIQLYESLLNRSHLNLQHPQAASFNMSCQATVQLSEQGCHDALTDRPSQLDLEERIRHMRESAPPNAQHFALLYVGLNSLMQAYSIFREAVLREVAGRLRRAIRDNDVVACVADDVFGVLLMGTHAQSDIRQVAEKVQAAVAAPVHVGNQRIRVTCNIGCVRYPLDGSDALKLHTNATDALFQAGLEGGGHFHFHDVTCRQEHPFSMGLAIWGAVERGEMHLVYQPRVALGPDPIINACEALLRWYHPVRGVISPSVFIPLAERNGAILALGDWVLEQAIKQAARWHASGLIGLRVAVNVSPLQLDAPDFVEHVTGLAAHAGVEACCIELDMTTSMVSGPVLSRLDTLARLRQVGFRVGLVDGAKGLSFLSGMQPLPIDCLKIDRQLVQELSRNHMARAMMRCVVDMGNTMGVDVVAEGVETEEQLAELTSQGCQLVQGFLTGRPMSSQMILGFMMGAQKALGAYGAKGLM